MKGLVMVGLVVGLAGCDLLPKDETLTERREICNAIPGEAACASDERCRWKLPTTPDDAPICAPRH